MCDITIPRHNPCIQTQIMDNVQEVVTARKVAEDEASGASGAAAAVKKTLRVTSLGSLPSTSTGLTTEPSPDDDCEGDEDQGGNMISKSCKKHKTMVKAWREVKAKAENYRDARMATVAERSYKIVDATATTPGPGVTITPADVSPSAAAQL